MFGFHSGLTSPDSFSSPWWSWPFMVRPGGNVPRWFDITYLPNNVNSTISAFGNPIVWWIGFAAVVVLIGIVIYKSGILQGIAAKKLTSKFHLKQARFTHNFHSGCFPFLLVTLRRDFESNLLLPFLSKRAASMFSPNILYQQILGKTNWKSCGYRCFCSCCGNVHSVLPRYFWNASFKRLHT